MIWKLVKVLTALIICQIITNGNCQKGDSTVTTIPKPDIYQLHVNTDVQYRYATTVVQSRVVNPADVAQEIGFTVVLPETAFISGFLMEIKGKVYNAYVKEKEEAKKTYEAAVQEGRGGAYVEQSARDSNQFTVSVNIEPQDKVNFNLTYEELLHRELGTYSIVNNINAGQIVKDLSVIVNINETSEITKVVVPALKVENDVAPNNTQNPLAVIERKSPNVVTITYAPTPSQQKEISQGGINGQLIVNYDVDRNSSQTIQVNDGYFVHFFAPETLEPLPKHVVFVLDYSGSMLGRKIEQLKDAMNTILSDLSVNDYFSIVLFSNSADTWSPTAPIAPKDNYRFGWGYEEKPKELGRDHIVPAKPENIEAAKQFIKTYNDYGGTNIIAGLRDGLRLVDMGAELLKNNAIPPEPIIMFLTDGEPNIELSDPDQIIARFRELNTRRVVTYSLAFGFGADFKFLRKLSLSTDAMARTIYEGADAAIQLEDFYKLISSPLLSNIKYEYIPGQVDNGTSTKQEFPVFFYGSEIVVAGKYFPCIRPMENVQIGTLSGRSLKGDKIYPIVIPGLCPRPPPIVPVKAKPGPLEKVWAYLTIQQQLDKLDALNGEAEKNATKAEALKQALHYQFVTKLTSLVVVKPNETNAVDATQIRPGAQDFDSAPTASRNIIASGIPRASFARFPVASKSVAHNMVFPVNVQVAQDTVDYEEPAVDIVETNTMMAYTTDMTPVGEKLEKVNLEDLQWLSSVRSKDNSTVTLLLDSGAITYKLGHNEPNKNYGNCVLPHSNSTGACQHIEYCALKEYQIKLDDFLPYRCDIPNGYLGTCCPEYY